MKQRLPLQPIALACLLAALSADAAADSATGGAGARPYIDEAALARCDGSSVARADEPSRVSPEWAFTEKQEYQDAVLLLDVRGRAEAAGAGWPTFTDALVPYGDVAQTDRHNRARDDAFVAAVDRRVHAFGGDRRSRILVLGGTGEQAADAARALSAAGYRNVAAVEGGFEGQPAADGHRHGGWKGSELPWTISLTGPRPVGLRD